MYYKRWTAEINPYGLYYVRKTYIIESEKRWVTIDGRHVNIGGDDGGGGSGSGAIRLRINLFDKNDQLYSEAMSIEQEEGFEDICAHGSSRSIEVRINGKKVQMNAEQFADYLKKQNKTGDFRLASCSTGCGDNSFAQQLSKIMQNKIKAPDDDVYYIPEEGILRIGSKFTNVGSWRVFDKGVEISD